MAADGKDTMYLHHDCVTECCCHGQICLPERFIEFVRMNFSSARWTSAREWPPGSKLSKNRNDALNSSKFIVLWTSETCTRYNELQHSDFRLLLQMALYKASDSQEGNYIVHIALEEGAVPEAVSKWVNTTYVDTEKKGCTQQLKAILEGSCESTIGERLRKLKDIRICRGLITIIPSSGTFFKFIPGGEHTEHEVKEARDTAGTTQRSYQSSIYAFKDEKHQIYHAAVEYATPVRAMFLMANPTEPGMPSTAGMSQDWLRHEVEVFANNLAIITRNNLSKEDEADLIFVPFDDSKLPRHDTDPDGYRQAAAIELPKLLLPKIKENLC